MHFSRRAQLLLFFGHTGERVKASSICIQMLALLSSRGNLSFFVRKMGVKIITPPQGIVLRTKWVNTKKIFRMVCSWVKERSLSISCGSCWVMMPNSQKGVRAQSCPTLLQPHGPWSARLLCPWNFLGKNAGVSCHFLLQGILPTQGSNPHLLCLLHCRQILYHLSHQGTWIVYFCST